MVLVLTGAALVRRLYRFGLTFPLPEPKPALVGLSQDNMRIETCQKFIKVVTFPQYKNHISGRVLLKSRAVVGV
jgi:hypothetical protein